MHRVWTLYGRTASKHIFCAIKERGESAGAIPYEDKGSTKIEEDWQVSWIDIPIARDIAAIATPCVKSVGVGWEDAKPKAPRKFVTWPGGRPTDTLLEKLPKHGGVALKDILVGAGLVSSDSAAVAGRKSVIEIRIKYNSKERQPGETNYDFFARVNGKEELLSKETVAKLWKQFVPHVLKNQVSDGVVVNLTRLRGGRGSLSYGAADAIRMLSNALTDEPSWLHTALEKAVEEYQS